MAPTLEDQDRLIVNKLAYRLHDPQVGDIVMLLYPEDPDKSFVKRIVAEPGDTIRSVNGRVFRNDVPLPDDFIPEEYRIAGHVGARGRPAGLLLRDGRPPEQQLRQPKLGPRAEEIHHRQGPAPLVADQPVCGGLKTGIRSPGFPVPPFRRSYGRSVHGSSRTGNRRTGIDEYIPSIYVSVFLHDHAPLNLQRRRELAGRDAELLGHQRRTS